MNDMSRNSSSLDLTYIQAALPDLKDFILSDQTSWPLTGMQRSQGIPLPDLSAGYLLLSLRRLSVDVPLEKETGLKNPLQEEFNQVITNWRSTWTAKCLKEMRSRVRIWEKDITDREINERANWAVLATNRTVIQLLKEELEGHSAMPADLKNTLQILDTALSSRFVHGQFLWSDELRSAFPQESYWYLYGSVRSRGSDGKE
jgi:hypothetical protein